MNNFNIIKKIYDKSQENATFFIEYDRVYRYTIKYELGLVSTKQYTKKLK